MRALVYLDQAYWRDGEGIWAQRAFVLFLGALAEHCDELTLLGRVSPAAAQRHYRLDDRIRFASLPGYASAASPPAVLRAIPGSLRAFWRQAGGADVAWLLGPSPLSILFALAARLRGKPVVLGVRQDLPAYSRGRHPGRRGAHLAADLMELAFRVLARGTGVVVVGPDLARRYRRARRVLPIAVSLVRESELTRRDRAPSRDWEGELTVLTVSRLDPEKNPLLLADVLAALGDRWRMVICGEGPLEGELADRLTRLGVAERAELRGHVPLDAGLAELYRSAHALVHVSFTEGVPQVLIEAFAAGLPVVATDVGGVAGLAAGAAELIPPRDAGAAASALERLADDPARRATLVEAGLERAADLTIEAESGRVAAFLAEAARA